MPAVVLFCRGSVGVASFSDESVEGVGSVVGAVEGRAHPADNLWLDVERLKGGQDLHTEILGHPLREGLGVRVAEPRRQAATRVLDQIPSCRR